MTTLDHLNKAFTELEKARRNDTGTDLDMIAIWDAALMVQEAAWGVYTVRVANKVWRPLPTLTPLPPVMTAEQLKEMLNPVTTAAEQHEKSQN